MLNRIQILEMSIDFADTDAIFVGIPKYLSNYHKTMINIPYGETSNIFMGIASHYSSLPVKNGLEKCILNEQIFKSTWLCYYAAILETCNCSATAFSYMSPAPSPGVIECNMNIYNNCRILTSKSESKYCKEFSLTGTLPPPCETWSFLSVISGSSNEPWSTDEMTAVQATTARFSVKNFIYAEIEEQPVFTYQQFLAAFGGMLGIWLGLSFFSLVRILAFPTEFILGFLIPRRIHEKFSKIINPQKNLKLKKKIRSRAFLTVEYLFDFKFDKLQRKANLQKIFTYTGMKWK
jgi:hypothetical protein